MSTSAHHGLQLASLFLLSLAAATVPASAQTTYYVSGVADIYENMGANQTGSWVSSPFTPLPSEPCATSALQFTLGSNWANYHGGAGARAQYMSDTQTVWTDLAAQTDQQNNGVHYSVGPIVFSDLASVHFRLWVVAQTGLGGEVNGGADFGDIQITCS